MSLTKTRRNEIKKYILWNLSKHPGDIAHLTQSKFNISRTTVYNYLADLAREKKISVEGNNRERKYSLNPLIQFSKKYPIKEKPAEDKIWRDDILQMFSTIKENIINICHYGFTEIFNNAVDHSDGRSITVNISIWIDRILMCINDDGVGIFNKIQKTYSLDDPYHAILELAKGKLTTNPDAHTGEGIFFTSRMFDTFVIYSGKYYFASKGVDIMVETDKDVSGTEVYMEISQNSDRTTKKIFSKFTNSDTFGFEKTIVPVELALYGNENLVSRSQAKRLMSRLEKFNIVVLDFDHIETIGRAFADEIFRVYVKSHPNIQIHTIHDNRAIRKLVEEIQNNLDQLAK
jgi:anti-sigma regulatory factor (Ser/Thr protein kinase)